MAYGTLSESDRAENGLLNGVDGERAALLAKSGNDDSFLKRSQRHMTADVHKAYGDLVLLFCYIITGLLDSSSVQVWGSFVSMQTGKFVVFGCTQPNIDLYYRQHRLLRSRTVEPPGSQYPLDPCRYLSRRFLRRQLLLRALSPCPWLA